MAFRDDDALPDGLRPLGPGDPAELGGHRLVGILGQGGMGTVYLGLMRSGRRLAVKVVRPEFTHDTEFRSRFQREVAAALRVRGPRTAMLVDADLDHDPPWLATEYVPGPTLAQAVRRDGPLAEAAVRDLVRNLAEGLKDVHRAGMVHRDLKPANVILGPDGPCVIDMGIARAGDATSLTATGAMLGTPVFMAPEQALGRETTPATDVWSLGAVAYFAATGRMAFGTARADIMYYRVVHEPPDLEGCPASLRPFVEACLAKDPAHRPPLASIDSTFPPGAHVPSFPTDADDAPTHLATAAGRTAAPGPLPPSGTPSPASSDTPPRRRRRLVAALATVGLLGVSGAGIGIAVALQNDSPTPPDPEAPAITAADDEETAGTASEASDPPDEAAAGDEMDSCLVGRWEQTSMSDEWTLLGEPVDVTGWDGRILEFHEDGTETVFFDDADPVTGWMINGDFVDTWSGTATYRVRTHDGVLTFDDVDYADTTVERNFFGATETYDPPDVPSADVEYTCDETTLTQADDNYYDATFERVDDGGDDDAPVGWLR